MSKETIHTDSAPAAIGTYSQAAKVGDFVFISGQIPLVPATMEIVEGDFAARARQVFENLKAIAAASGSSLDNAVKLTIFLTDLDNFATVNEIMADRARMMADNEFYAKEKQAEGNAVLYTENFVRLEISKNLANNTKFYFSDETSALGSILSNLLPNGRG